MRTNNSTVHTLLLCGSRCGAESAEEFPGEPVLRQRLRVDVLPDEAVGEGGEALEGAAVGHGRVLVAEERAEALHAGRETLVRRLDFGAKSRLEKGRAFKEGRYGFKEE